VKQLMSLSTFLSKSTIFLALYALAALLPLVFGESLETPSQIAQLFLACGIAGIMAPLLSVNKAPYTSGAPSTPPRIMAGIAALVAALVLEIAFYSSWFVIVSENTSGLVRIKHILFALPLATALAFHFYYVIPFSADRYFRTKTPSALAAAAASGLLFGTVLFVKTGFARIDLFLVMTGVGTLIAAGLRLTGRFFLMYPALFLAVYTNSLAEQRYSDYSWPATIAGFLFCFGLMLLSFLVRLKSADPGDGVNPRKS